MTLLINDIHIRGDLREGYILTVADRRISYKKVDGKRKDPKHQKKVFRIPYLNATIGYFGLAGFRINNNHQFKPLSEVLRDFINHSYTAKTIGEFSNLLCKQLNAAINKDDLKEDISGFHICGYNKDDIPEFWVVRNIGDDYNQSFLDYYECAEKFLSRDAKKVGYDGITPVTSKLTHSYYVNGDPEPFHRIWRPLDEFVNGMIQRGGFGKKYGQFEDRSDKDLCKIAEWQMKVIGDFYNQFGNEGKKIVGGRGDAIVLRPKKPLPKKLAVYLEGGPAHGWVYDVSSNTINTVRVLVGYSNDEEGRISSLEFEEIASESDIDFSKYNYYRRADRANGLMPIFALIEPT